MLICCQVAAYHVTAKVTTGRAAVKLLARSERVAGDLEGALSANTSAFDLRVILREYVNVEPHTEFRTFRQKRSCSFTCG